MGKAFRAYSCAMFETPKRLNVNELVRAGTGPRDDFDSPDKAPWLKFKDAIDFVDPDAGEALRDLGCGCGGQLRVTLHGFQL